MQDKVELAQVRTFGEIVEDTVQFFKQNWKPLLRSYFVICGFFWIASLMVGVFNQVQIMQRLASGESQFGYLYFISLGFELMSFMMMNLTVLCFIRLYKEKGGEAPSVEEVWAYVKYYFLRVLGSYIASIGLLILGAVCCLIPAVYLSIVFSLIYPVMIMENATTNFAFSRSFQLIKNNWWLTLGVFVIMELIIVAAMLAITIPVMLIAFSTTFLTNINFISIYTYATVIITHFFQFLYILPLIGIAFTYFTLIEKKENGTLQQRIMMLGKNELPAADQFTTEEY